VDVFFANDFENRPLHIKRGKRDYYKRVLSTKDFDNMLRHKNVLFGKNLDVTSYSDGKRETHNPEGRAYGPGTEINILVKIFFSVYFSQIHTMTMHTKF
jgi:lysine-specific demethylase/histidyl-hydroxylase NO66